MNEVPPEDGEGTEPPKGAERPFEEAPASADAAELRAALSAAIDRICPAWLADRADDLIQAALMRVLEIQRKREGTVAFTSLYLRRTAYCALVDEIRRLRRRREVPIEAETEEQFLPSERPDPERFAAGREAGRAIRGCLAAMIRPRRLAVTLYLQGHGTAAVGDRLGWAPKKAENLIYRGLADLRECLAKKGIRR